MHRLTNSQLAAIGLVVCLIGAGTGIAIEANRASNNATITTTEKPPEPRYQILLGWSGGSAYTFEPPACSPSRYNCETHTYTHAECSRKRDTARREMDLARGAPMVHCWPVGVVP